MMQTMIDLRAERESRKLSRADLADIAGVTISTIATMERGGEPRGGPADAQRVWDAIGAPPASGVVISVGDVIVARARVRSGEVMLLVRDVTDTEITGVEMFHYTGKSFKTSMDYGAQSYKHRGTTYLLRHRKTVRRDAITRHWPAE